MDAAASASAEGMVKLIGAVNTHLTTRTFLVGHHLTAADLALWEALKKHSAVWAGAAASAPHVSRWCGYLESLPALQKASALVVKVAEKQKEIKESGTSGSFNIPLPGAEMGKMCTRFPPEPSGYLHIGHAKGKHQPNQQSGGKGRG